MTAVRELTLNTKNAGRTSGRRWRWITEEQNNAVRGLGRTNYDRGRPTSRGGEIAER